MKKVLIFIAMLTISISAQIKLEKGGVLFWADSLWGANDTLIVTDSIFRTADTVVVVDSIAGHTSSVLELNGQFDWMNITAIDTGTTYDDSCVVQYGILKIWKDASTPYAVVRYDTLWQRVQFMRDSSWTNTNFIVDGNSTKSYRVFVGDYDLIRVYMSNVQAVNNRLFRFYATLSRKK